MGVFMPAWFPKDLRLSRPAACALAATLALACDTNQRGRDASSAPTSQRVAEVAVRLDVPSAGAPSVSVLAFRAQATGVLPSDVLGAVDPLVAAPPEGRCELREVAGAARVLRAQGGALALEELANVQIALGPGGPLLIPAPRVYPQLAAVVGGVIGEAGPVDVAVLPETVGFTLAVPEGGGGSVSFAVPEVPRVLGEDGQPLGQRVHLDLGAELALAIAGPPKSFLEIRPFGSPLAIACPPEPSGRVQVPRELIERLQASSGRVPFSFEAVFRDQRVLSPAAAGGDAVQLSLEARSSAVLELRP